MQIITNDVLEDIKKRGNCSIHTTFSDFPYFLGTEWHYINGILQMKGNGKDFMGAWGIQNAAWWRDYFSHLFRVMKYGGYVVFYSISQQSWAFSALMVEAGFEKCQELHWANISNFPKSSDSSKAIDKRLGAVREVVGLRNPHLDGGKIKRTKGAGDFKGVSIKDTIDGQIEVTAPATDLAKLFEGYKYGKAPLKKITEPILVFRKPCKNGSVLNDLMQCQNDIEISPAVLDIERNRVGTREKEQFCGARSGINRTFNMPKYEKKTEVLPDGRFPTTLFISPEATELLDSQLDFVTFELNGKIHTTKRLEYQRLVSLHVLNNTFESCKVLGVKRESLNGNASTRKNGNEFSNKHAYGKYNQIQTKNEAWGDRGYISRVLHQPDFTEADYCQYSQGFHEDTVYMPTVSPTERHAGCGNLIYKGIENLFVVHTKKGKTQRSKVSFDELIDLDLASLGKSSKDKDKAICKAFFDFVCETSEEDITDTNFVECLEKLLPNENNVFQFEGFFIEAKNVIRSGNGHPTLKPIALNKHVLSLYLQPKEFNQVLYIPFSGSGSEVIGAFLAGFNIENIISVEQNSDFVAIQKSRIAFYSQLPVNVPISVLFKKNNSESRNLFS